MSRWVEEVPYGWYEESDGYASEDESDDDDGYGVGGHGEAFLGIHRRRRRSIHGRAVVEGSERGIIRKVLPVGCCDDESALAGGEVEGDGHREVDRNRNQGVLRDRGTGIVHMIDRHDLQKVDLQEGMVGICLLVDRRAVVPRSHVSRGLQDTYIAPSSQSQPLLSSQTHKEGPKDQEGGLDRQGGGEIDPEETGLRKFHPSIANSWKVSTLTI